MIPRASLPRAVPRVLRPQCSKRPNNQRTLASAKSGGFNYETGEANGVKFASRDIPGPTTQLAVVARAGTRFQVYPGFAEGLEKFAFKSTHKRSSLRITREAELLGAELFAYHSRENLVVGAKFLREDLPYFTELLGEVVSKTKFLRHELNEEVIPIIKLGQKHILGNTAEMAVNSAHAVAFHRGLGTALHPTSSVPITKYLHEEDLKTFSQAAYAKPNFAVVANGTSHDELSKWVGEFFNDSPTAPPKDFPPIETKPSKYYGGEERIAHDGGNNMIIGFPGSGAYTGGHYDAAIAVLSSLLGGQSYIKWSPGFSLLARATAAQTQAHVSTRNISYSDAGLLTIAMGGNARHIKEASIAIVEILKAISGGDIAKDDITKAKANAKFRTLSAGENTGTGLELTGAGLVQSGKASQLHGIADAIDGVTEDAVKKAAGSLLEGKATVSAVGDLFVLPFAEEIGLHSRLIKNSYNRYLAVAARAVRRSLKEQPRLQAERRGEMDLRFAKWTVEALYALYEPRRQRLIRIDVVQLHVAAEQQPDSSDQHLSQPSSRPKHGDKGKNVKGITSEFRDAATALETGQLVKDPYFTLFEAVGALEIMDPKMDSGFLAEDEPLDDTFNVLKEVLPEEVVGLMDQMLCHEMAWHMGHPLSTSLFTSYHLDRLLWPDPKRLDDARFDRHEQVSQEDGLLHVIFRAYCLATIKCCNFVHRRVSTEHYYEVSVCQEEDFVSNLYNRKLLDDFRASDMQQLLDQALKVAEEISAWDDALQKAISVRLTLRRRLLIAMQFDLNPDQEARIRCWKHCSELLPALIQTHTVSKPVTAAFSIKIQRRLASSVPPRPMVEATFGETHAFLANLCRDAADVYRVLEYHGSTNILNFACTFQFRKPQPSIYVRCLLQSMIFHDMKVLGSVTITQTIHDDLEELVLPADTLLDPANGNVEAPHDPRFQIAKEMRAFVLRVGDSFLDIFRAVCMNRPRMRRMLCHLVSDWESVQLEAENLDVELRKYTREKPLTEGDPTGIEIWSFPLSSWAYYYKLRQMEWIIQLGFELDIYQDDELPGMYWYLSNVAGAKIQHLERIQTFVTRRSGQSKKLSPSQKASFKRCFSLLDVTLLETSATQWFAIALSKLHTILSLLLPRVEGHPPLPYSTAELRHALRMRPFMQLSIPEPAPYAELSAATSIPSGTAEDESQGSIKDQAMSMLETAGEAARTARKEWEALGKLDAKTARCVNCEEWWRASVKDVIRACIACSITVATTEKGVQTALGMGRPLSDVLTAEMPRAGKRYHDFWIVPKLTVQQYEKTAISSSDYSNLGFFEQFAAAAYCPLNNRDNAGGTKITCSAGNCPLVESNDVISVYEFENSLKTDVTGYVAIDNTRALTVLAFRGSQSVRNFVTDANFPATQTDICPSCTAHAGFWDSWVEARPGVMAALKTAAASHPNNRVAVVGHSLGGAIADLAAAEIRKSGVTADLYTYGAPRIAGATLSNFISNQNMGGNFRVTHKDDPVPRLPPIVLGFVHISPEYYISSPNDVVPTANDITKYTGAVNLLGNSGNNPLNTDLSAHGWYFNAISACGGSDFEFKK
ncbi:MAG: hypothetical protein L6R35_000003 [Caloplaca aegaea]|nr:MAG: hypothetical protein L6R35_000003 [Caloplaca aegaea]